MTDWLKNHVEAIICFALFGLLILTSLYFLSAEEQRIEIGELEEVRIDEARRDEVIEQAMQDIAHQRRRIMTAFLDKPVLHYDLLLRRNPFQPLSELDEPDVRLPVTNDVVNGNDLPPPPDLVVRGIIRIGDEYVANIENRVTGETYFRRVGEEVEGHMVEDITRDKVVLSIDDEIVELRYRR